MEAKDLVNSGFEIGPFTCKYCGWIGAEDDMLFDEIYSESTGDEIYSFHICPCCERWPDIG